MIVSGELAFPEKTLIRDGRKLSRRSHVVRLHAFYKETSQTMVEHGPTRCCAPRTSAISGQSPARRSISLQRLFYAARGEDGRGGDRPLRRVGERRHAEGARPRGSRW